SLEDALAADARRGVLADRPELVGLARPAGRDWGERVHVTSRERDDARPRVSFRAVHGHDRVHGPGRGWRAAGTELLPGHEHDVVGVGQLVDSGAIEQIAANGLDARIVERALGAARRPARNG